MTFLRLHRFLRLRISINFTVLLYVKGQKNYNKMKKRMKNSGIVEELMSVIFHPKNMDKWIDWGFIEHQEMLDLFI